MLRVTLASSEDKLEELLERVRRLEPRQLMRLAGLWAGVSHGELDPHRQRRRNAARLALRYVSRQEGRAAPRARSVMAAMAVAEAMASNGADAPLRLRGPAADAAFAVADALDALANARRLAPIAYEELMRPWTELMAELGGVEVSR